MNKTPTTLIIMDGYGLSGEKTGNAISAANTPCLDKLFAEYAHTTLAASGLDVGLPQGLMGNKEFSMKFFKSFGKKENSWLARKRNAKIKSYRRWEKCHY